MSKTVLFAWELGEGLGHLPALKAIASALKAEGVTPVFALRDPVQTRAALGELEAMILPAPFWPMPAPPAAQTGTYADILAGNGYATAQRAAATIAAWDQIIDLVKPQLVVCEHAPSAALSAFGRIPVAFVGNGFVVPPANGAEFPPYRAGKESGTVPQRPVFDAIREALTGLGRRAPTALCEPFRGVFHGVYAFPALDHYVHARRGPTLGPIEPQPPLREAPTQRALFAYSAADYPLIDELVQGLMTVGREASAFFRGALGSRGSVLRSRGVNVWDAAPALSDVLPAASLVFSHGGTGLTNAALAAGRPHIVAPRHLEAQLTGERLQALGAGIVLPKFDRATFADAVKRISSDKAAAQRANEVGGVAQTLLKAAAPLERTLEALRPFLK